MNAVTGGMKALEEQRIKEIEEKMQKCKDEGKVARLSKFANINGNPDYKTNPFIYANLYVCEDSEEKQKCENNGCEWHEAVSSSDTQKTGCYIKGTLMQCFPQ